MKHYFNYIVLLISITLSLFLAWTTQQNINENDQLKFQSESQELTLKIKGRMESYRQVLYAGVSLFNVSDNVSQEDWHKFVKTLEMDENFIGIQGLGFSKVIDKNSLKTENTHQEIYTSILYLEPLDSRNIRAIGYDMFSEKTRREAMNRALDSGKAAMSGKVRLVQENGKNEQAGFLTYVPVFKKGASLQNRAERVEALKGFVYAAFRADDLIEGIMGERFKHVKMSVYDGTESQSNLLFKTNKDTLKINNLTCKRYMNIDGRDWLIVKQPDEGFFEKSPLVRFLPVIVFLIGMIFSFLIFILISFMASRQKLSQELADNISKQYVDQTKRLNNILEGTNVGTWEWNIQTGETVFNGRWVNMLGYSLEELSPTTLETLTHLLHPDDAFIVDKEIQSHFSGESEFYRVEIRLRHKDGHWVWILAKGKVFDWDMQGKPLIMYGTHQDISETKSIEQQIVKEKNFISAIVENANAIIAVIDSSGTMVRLNPYGQEFTQYSQEEMASEPYFWKRLIPTEIQDSVMDLIKNARKGIITESFQNAWTAKDGTQKMFEWSNTLVNNPDGSMDYIATIGVDITEIKDMEANLIAAKEQAIAASISKSDFLANMSHEIRTPMNAIIGLSQLMQESDLKPKDMDSVEKILGSSKMLLGIINDILDYSKIEAKKLLLDKEPLDIENVLSQLRVMFTQNAMDKEVELNFYFSDKLPGLILADELRLTQVLTNLLSNALKFTAQGMVTLEITLIEQTDKKARIEFSVTDTGIGLTPQESTKLFQPFTQADSSITRKYGGTGLGLAITQNLITAMGSELQIKSEKGVGSNFYFVIDTDVIKWPRVYPEVVERDYKILLVDDQEISRTFLSEIAGHFGCITHQATNGNEALDMIEQQDQSGTPYDAILIDHFMPIMDGKQTISKIKALEDNGHFKSKTPSIIMMSTDAITDSGAETFLTKPITSSSFLDALSEISNPLSLVKSEKVEIDRSSQIKHTKILLVEDNKLNQEVVKGMLKVVGIEDVKVASNGQEAVDIYLSQPDHFDLILMDMQMPIMSGYEAAIEIRKHSQDIPIIALTAAALVEDKERALEVGMNDHLSKPIDMEQLFKMIETWSFENSEASSQTIEHAAVYEVLNLDYLRSFIGEDSAMMIEFLSAFLKQLEDDFSHVINQLETQCPDSAAQLHAIHGVAGNLGAHKVSHMSDELNQILGTGNWVTAKQITLLEEAISELKSELENQITFLKNNADDN